jgi:hypothetical protein
MLSAHRNTTALMDGLRYTRARELGDAGSPESCKAWSQRDGLSKRDVSERKWTDHPVKLLSRGCTYRKFLATEDHLKRDTMTETPSLSQKHLDRSKENLDSKSEAQLAERRRFIVLRS